MIGLAMCACKHGVNRLTRQLSREMTLCGFARLQLSLLGFGMATPLAVFHLTGFHLN